MVRLIEDCREKYGSVLLICNTKSEAREVYLELAGRDCTGLFHLSTAMCMEHRLDVLRQIQESLKEEGHTVCVSTQLVEAGVDFSFGCVIRILAGLDNVVQAAGRGNRHGEKESLCPVYIINWDAPTATEFLEILSHHIRRSLSVNHVAQSLKM